MVISLHSKFIPQYSEDVLYPSLCIPQEILEIILINAGEYTENIWAIMLVSTEFRKIVLSLLPRVIRLTVSGIHLDSFPILDSFTGVQYLEIQDDESWNYLDLRMFRESIWENMKYLKISRRLAKQLASDSYSKYFLTNLYPTFFMPNLTSLDIADECYNFRDLDILPTTIPSLRKLKLSRCILEDIGHFKTLNILEIYHNPVDVIADLSKLNITELTLSGTNFSGFSKLNIPSLRKLKIKDCWQTTGSPNHLNLVELVLINVSRTGNPKYMKKLNIPSLKSLTLGGSDLEEWMDWDSLYRFKIEELTLIGFDNNSVPDHIGQMSSIPSLKSLTLKMIYRFRVAELPNLESLVLVNSSLEIRNMRMEWLTNLDICTFRSNTGLDINRLNFPNLRSLNTYGHPQNINRQGMLDRDWLRNIVVSSKYLESLHTVDL